jgi:hypothetical protein
MSITQRGRKFKKGIIYPLFFEVSEKCEEEYWKQFFVDLSIGKNSKGLIVNNGMIYSNNKKNGFCYHFSNKNSIEIIEELLPILSNNYITCSDKNIKNKNIIEQVKKDLQEIKTLKWTKIRRKNIKITMIMNYIIDLKNTHKLNQVSCSNVYRILYNNVSSQKLSKLITTENGKIKNIDGIKIIDKDLYFNLDYEEEKEEKEFEKEEKEYEKEEENEREEIEDFYEYPLEIIWENYIKRYLKNNRILLS